MYKGLLISGLILMYFTLLFLPNLPFIEYYYVQSKLQNDKQSLTKEESNVLVGDICYLKALIDRTKQSKDAAKDNKLPEPNNSSSLVYLITDIVILKNANSSNNIKFLNRIELLTYRYLQIPSPPPKLLS